MINNKKTDLTKKLTYRILFCVLSVTCFCVLWKANWLYGGSLWGDDYLFLMTTAIGKAAHGCTWDGRFYPLGHSDYSILLLVPYGKTALAHYIYNCVILVASSLMMFSFLKKATKKNYAVSLFSLLILFSISSFMQIHMECFYPEKTLSFLLCVFMWSYTKAEKTDKFPYYLLTFVVAAYATYMKEPVFGIFAIIAVTELLFDDLSPKSKFLNYSLLFNSLVFVAIYVYRRLFRKYTGIYASVSSNISDLSFSLFVNEPILYFIVGLTLLRLYFVLIRKDREHIFTDALLFASTGYAFAYFLLRLNHSYYLFPSVVLFLPAFAVFIAGSKCFVKILSVIISISCVASQFACNKYAVLNVWDHREKDHLFFEHIVDEYHAGKKIYWFSDPLLEKNDPGYCHLDNVMFLDRFQHFLNYYSNHQIIINRIFDLSNIDDKCVVLCSCTTAAGQAFDKTRKELYKRGLAQTMSLVGHLMFSKK